MFSASVSQLPRLVLVADKDKLWYSAVRLTCFNSLFEGGMARVLEMPLCVY